MNEPILRNVLSGTSHVSSRTLDSGFYEQSFKYLFKPSNSLRALSVQATKTSKLTQSIREISRIKWHWLSLLCFQQSS